MLSTKDCSISLFDQILIRYCDSTKSQVLLARAVCLVSKLEAMSTLCWGAFYAVVKNTPAWCEQKWPKT